MEWDHQRYQQRDRRDEVMCDWTAAEHEYVTGDAGYRSIAAKHGVSKYAVERHGRLNGWPQKRQEYRDSVSARAVQQTADRVADTVAQTLTNVYDAALLLSENLLADLRAIKSFKSYEYGHYASALKTIHDMLPQAQMEMDDQEQKFVAMLPDRTEIDEGG